MLNKFWILLIVTFLSSCTSKKKYISPSQNLYYLLLNAQDSSQYNNTYTITSIYPIAKKMQGGLLLDPHIDSTAFELKTNNRTDTFSFKYSKRTDEEDLYLTFENLKYYSNSNLKYAINQIDTFRGYSYKPFITFYIP